ncbi:hypothetical protein D3C80_674240 [compost metagenome]
MALAGAQGDQLGLGAGRFFHAGLAEEEVHQVGGQFDGLGFAVEAAQEVFRGVGPLRVADQFELVAAVADFDVHALFDQAQVLVELPAQVGEAASFKRFQGEAVQIQGGVQCRVFALGRQERESQE